ncbi:hypothetical protein EST38_g1529 [Candolleomyces aberdarensis]|uniref:Uncharacterized protein n=1 Tax=Candolleomyces aberdarensis TaxID=2316362 RepID=A0A4V1Q547_9AGAR|nr:hypothetical protein EST38_g1529 [Candolleomyces aberdarensis]
MLSTRYRSVVFKFLLAGLLALLVASYSVDAAPTGKAPAKAPAKAAPPPKAAPKATPPAKAPAGKAPAAKKCLLKGSKNPLRKRAGVSHPDGKSSVVLFHGTSTQAFAESLKNPDLTKTYITGDLHSNSHGVCGGFYLTDSLIAAAQFVCHSQDAPTVPTTAYVLSYQWTPPTGLKLYSYPDSAKPKDIKDDQCKSHGMITAPMHVLPMDKDLTMDFRQYAIVQQSLLTGNLKYLKTYTIPCANVYKGANLPSEEYVMGQASSPDFATYSQQLQTGC